MLYIKMTVSYSCLHAAQEVCLAPSTVEGAAKTGDATGPRPLEPK